MPFTTAKPVSISYKERGGFMNDFDGHLEDPFWGWLQDFHKRGSKPVTYKDFKATDQKLDRIIELLEGMQVKTVDATSSLDHQVHIGPKILTGEKTIVDQIEEFYSEDFTDHAGGSMIANTGLSKKGL